MSYKTIPDEDDGFGQIIPPCREYRLSRVNPRSRVCAAIPGGTFVGPVIEVQIVKILDQYGLEIASPSHNNTQRTSHVMISRGKSRFVDEIHIPTAKLRYSAELLSELQKAEGREPCLAQSKTSIQETGATHVSSQTSIKETCADTLSVYPSQALFFSHKEPFLRSRGSGQLFLPIHRMEEFCQQRSPKWLLTIKIEDNLTQRFAGTR